MAKQSLPSFLNHTRKVLHGHPPRAGFPIRKNTSNSRRKLARIRLVQGKNPLTVAAHPDKPHTRVQGTKRALRRVMQSDRGDNQPDLKEKPRLNRSGWHAYSPPRLHLRASWLRFGCPLSSSRVALALGGRISPLNLAEASASLVSTTPMRDAANSSTCSRIFFA